MKDLFVIPKDSKTVPLRDTELFPKSVTDYAMISGIDIFTPEGESRRPICRVDDDINRVRADREVIQGIGEEQGLVQWRAVNTYLSVSSVFIYGLR